MVRKKKHNNLAAKPKMQKSSGKAKKPKVKKTQSEKWKLRNQVRKLRASWQQNLNPIDWSAYDLEPFQKDFYNEHKKTASRSPEEVELYRSNNKITVNRTVPNPIMSFEECPFPKDCMNEIKHHNFTEPTPIQAQGWPVAMSCLNMVGIAKTGSGKTLAYLLPAIAHIKAQSQSISRDGPIALILVPTTISAQKMHTLANEFASSVWYTCIFGGVSFPNQAKDLRHGVELLIATPGRLLNFLVDKTTNLKHCTYLVLDELDCMLDMGLELPIRKIMSQIRPDRQILMYSATWPNNVRQLAEEYLGDYIQINAGPLQLSGNPKVKQIVEIVPEIEKGSKLLELLAKIYKVGPKPGKILVFAATKKRVDKVKVLITTFTDSCDSIHGNKSPTERGKIVSKFIGGDINILVATDIVAKGINVNGVEHVINFDFPSSQEDYIHRIGRTERLVRKKATGTAYSFFTRYDASMAQNLINVLSEGGQYIPPILERLALDPEPKKAFYGQRYEKSGLGKIDILLIKQNATSGEASGHSSGEEDAELGSDGEAGFGTSGEASGLRSGGGSGFGKSEQSAGLRAGGVAGFGTSREASGLTSGGGSGFGKSEKAAALGAGGGAGFGKRKEPGGLTSGGGFGFGNSEKAAALGEDFGNSSEGGGLRSEGGSGFWNSGGGNGFGFGNKRDAGELRDIGRSGYYKRESDYDFENARIQSRCDTDFGNDIAHQYNSGLQAGGVSGLGITSRLRGGGSTGFGGGSNLSTTSGDYDNRESDTDFRSNESGGRDDTGFRNRGDNVDTDARGFANDYEAPHTSRDASNYHSSDDFGCSDDKRGFNNDWRARSDAEYYQREAAAVSSRGSYGGLEGGVDFDRSSRANTDFERAGIVDNHRNRGGNDGGFRGRDHGSFDRRIDNTTRGGGAGFGGRGDDHFSQRDGGFGGRGDGGVGIRDEGDFGSRGHDGLGIREHDTFGGKRDSGFDNRDDGYFGPRGDTGVGVRDGRGFAGRGDGGFRNRGDGGFSRHGNRNDDNNFGHNRNEQLFSRRNERPSDSRGTGGYGSNAGSRYNQYNQNYRGRGSGYGG